jgi:histidyl-tRNA synthetase
LRLFDCKVPACRQAVEEAPSILDHLCKSCEAHFARVRKALDGFQIPYRVNHRLVRGLDYYMRTTFEVLTTALGAQDAVAGGGRYDGLVQALGGPDQPGVGFAVGVDRLMDLLQARAPAFEKHPHLFIAAVGESVRDMAFQWLEELRLQGVRAEMDFEDRSLKSQMRRANKLGAAFVLLLGDRELDEGEAVLRNMVTKEQERIPVDHIVEAVVGVVRKIRD